MNEEIESPFCRPLEGHYCVECCRRSGGLYSNLQKLQDGTEGCIGYRKETDSNIPPQTGFCKTSFCFKELIKDNKMAEELLNNVRSELAKRPPGRFDLKEVLKTIGYPLV